jgi:hypothetical protein
MAVESVALALKEVVMAGPASFRGWNSTSREFYRKSLPMAMRDEVAVGPTNSPKIQTKAEALPVWAESFNVLTLMN